MTRGFNPARSGVRALEALSTVTILRIAGGTAGRSCRMSVRTRLSAARSITLGDHVEILRNSTLDGSPGRDAAIRIGHRVRIKENVWLAAYGGIIDIGNDVLIGRNSVVHGHGGVRIGEATMLSPGCMVYSSTYVTWMTGTYQSQGFVRRRTEIGRNVWLGSGCIVLAGSVIGDDTIISALSVVRGELDPHSVYAGQPAIRMGDVSEVLARRSDEIDHWRLD